MSNLPNQFKCFLKKWRVVFERLAKQIALRGKHGSRRLPCPKFFNQNRIGNPDAVLLVVVPIEADSERCEHRRPAGKMHGFRIGQNAVEVEEQRVPGQNENPRMEIVRLKL